MEVGPRRSQGESAPSGVLLGQPEPSARGHTTDACGSRSCVWSCVSSSPVGGPIGEPPSGKGLGLTPAHTGPWAFSTGATASPRPVTLVSSAACDPSPPPSSVTFPWRPQSPRQQRRATNAQRHHRPPSKSPARGQESPAIDQGLRLSTPGPYTRCHS